MEPAEKIRKFEEAILIAAQLLIELGCTPDGLGWIQNESFNHEPPYNEVLCEAMRSLEPTPARAEGGL